MERVLIAGCGAVGSMFGAFLRRAGHEVTLLGRAGHMDAVRKDGLHVDGIWGEHHAAGFDTATAADQLRGRFDGIFVCVKSYDTWPMMQLVGSRLNDDGVAVSLQNGLGNVEALSACCGDERSLGASVLIGARLPAPGRVTVTVQTARVVLGPLAPADRSVRAAHVWAERLRQAGIDSEAADQILPALWSKVFYNAALNPLGALLRVHYGALGEDEDLRAIMDSVIDEAYAVAAARGVALPWPNAGAYRTHFYRQLLPDTFAHRSSMLQDLERGRRTEIQSINGQVCRYGAQMAIPTPTNDLLVRLISWRERQPPLATPEVR